MKRIVVILLLIGLIVAGAVEWTYAAFNAPGPAARSGSETAVSIKPGVGLKGIAQALADAGVIVHPDVFRIGVRVSGKAAALKAGEFVIPSRASMQAIMDILIAGKSAQHKLTVAEGLTSRMVYDLVKGSPDLAGEAGVVPPEGSLLPETYLFQHGMTRAQLIVKMQAALREVLDREWAGRAPGLPFRNKQEALILASIVEKETGITAERPHIAAVFINRLRIGMKLESDPTIIYGITGGYPLGRRIRQSEIHAATPTNTYVIAGLPPTPICNPGRDAIHAVLHPVASRDLYFVANGSGGHVFAATLEEQTRNVAAWRRIHLRGQ